MRFPIALALACLHASLFTVVGSNNCSADETVVRIRLSRSPLTTYQWIGGMPGAPIPMTKEPPGVTKPLSDPSARYAVLPTRVTPNGLVVAVTESPNSENGKLHVDLNSDGDLTNDEEPSGDSTPWMLRGPVAFQAEKQVLVKEQSIRLSFFRYTNKFAEGQKALQDQNNPLFVHRDDVTEGFATFGERTLSVVLWDRAASGVFPIMKEESSTRLEKGEAMLLIDRNADGKFSMQYEAFDLANPFTLDGTTFQLAGLNEEGTELILKRSMQSVPELPIPLDVVGSRLAPCRLAALEGSEISMPDDYRDKIVLLTFWATWCKPCLDHMPELARTRNRLQPAGVELLGICLDEEAQREAALEGVHRQSATWRHAFDGRGTKGELAQAFGITALPAYVILDGTTGKVLATRDEVKTGRIDESLNRILAIRDGLRSK